MKTKTTIINTIATLFAFLWIYTAIAKMMGYSIFLAQLKMSNLIGAVALPVSIAVPVTELAIAVSLLTGMYAGKVKWLKNGLIASAGLLVLFTLYISAMMLSNSHLPCTCGGFIQKLSWPQHLVFNIMLILIAITGILLMNEKKNTLYRHHKERSDLVLN